MIGIDRAFEESGMTLDQLASCTGLSRQRVESIVCGRWLPSPEQRELIARQLGHRADEISWGHTMDPRNVRYRRFGLPGSFEP
jgi:transcriptional regulator with XRE-family HTH domain